MQGKNNYGFLQYNDFTIVRVWCQSGIKGVNCVECKLLHCEYKGVSVPLQCIGLICFQHAIEMDFVSQKAPKNPDSNDSSPISISLKTKKLFDFFYTEPN